MRCLLLILSASILAAGCSASRHRPVVLGNSSLCWSPDAGGWEREWLAEAGKRLHHPFVFICHGSSEHGAWHCYPRRALGNGILVETVCRWLRALYPDRDILLICCNPSGETLFVRHCWYAATTVWSGPGQNLICSEDGAPEWGAGFITDFREGGR